MLSPTPKKKITRPGANRPSAFGLEAWSIVWGVYVGQGCISGEDPLDWIHILAHAHNKKEDEYYGWICIRDAKMAFTKQGNPSLVMKHEVAHLLCPNQGHTKKWREVLTQMGGGAEAKKYLNVKKSSINIKDKGLISKGENGQNTRVSNSRITEGFGNFNGGPFRLNSDLDERNKPS